MEAYYKVEIESSHAIVLEIQPSKGGDVSRMRILFQNETLVLSYPLQSKEVPAKYFKPLEPSAVSSSWKAPHDWRGSSWEDTTRHKTQLKGRFGGGEEMYAETIQPRQLTRTGNIN